MSCKVSVIVPTKNSSLTLEDCLKSVKQQSYENIELIVVDNFSSDSTQEIARKYTDRVYVLGPERSVQRNFGVENSSGEYVAIIDSDMILTRDVIKCCVEQITTNEGVGGVVIPEESFGKGFWAECKKLERSFYVGVSWMEAARFFRKSIYQKLGGYNRELISGEDWDLSQRVSNISLIARIEAFILHNEGNLKLINTLRKKYYYARNFSKYLKQNPSPEKRAQTSILARYALYLTRPKRLVKHPVLSIGMLFMKTCEFVSGSVGFVQGKFINDR